jgi:hypothetical protein
MHPITERLALLRHLWQCSTDATLLCRVGRWDRDHPHAGTFRLAMQDGEELAPADIVSRFRQPAPRDALDVEGFMRDHAVLVNKFIGRLVVKVVPLMGDVQGTLCEHLYCLAAPVAALLLAGHATLCAPERLLSLAVVARRSDPTPVCRHQEHLQPQINAGRGQGRGGYLSVGQLARKHHMPAIGLALEGDCLDRALNWPMQLHLEKADMLEVDTCGVTVPLATIAEGRELDGIEAVAALEARIPRCLARLHPPEERLEGPVQAPQRCLAAREVGACQIGVGGALVLQMRRLLAVGDAPLLLLPSALALGKRLVVERRCVSSISTIARSCSAVGYRRYLKALRTQDRSFWVAM